MKLPAFLDPDAPFDRPAPEVGPDGLTERQRRASRQARRLLLPLMVLLVAVLLVFYVFFDSAKVDGDSMLPTMTDSEYVLVTRGLPAPKRGDVVVLNVVEGGVPTEWIKRIVAVAGDRVSIAGNRAWVNGSPESFQHAIVDDGRSYPSGETIVPPGTVYFMGDNRPISLDSRFVGPFPTDRVHGKVIAVFAPITRIRLVPGP
jgi:signal peptidase I